MNRRFHFVFLLGIALAALFACTSKDDFMQPSVQDKTGEYPSLLSVVNFDFDSQGSSTVLSYVSEGNWRVSQVPSWMTVNPSSGGEGRTLITISTQLNTDWQDRSGTLVFEAPGSKTHQIAVKQPCPKLGLEVSRPDSMDVVAPTIAAKGSADGKYTLPFKWLHANGFTDPVALTLTSNINVEVVVNQPKYFQVSQDGSNWYDRLHLDGREFQDGQSVIYLNAVSNNYTKEDIEGCTVTLKPYTNGEYTNQISREAIANWTLDLSQTHLKFLLGLSADENRMRPDDFDIAFDELGYYYNDVEDASGVLSLLNIDKMRRPTDNKWVNIYVDCELDWEVDVKTKDGFAKILDESRDGGKNKIESKKIGLYHSATDSEVNPRLYDSSLGDEDNTISDTIVFRAKIPAGSGPVPERFITLKQEAYKFSLDRVEESVKNGLFLAGGKRVYEIGEGNPKKYSIELTTPGKWRLELEKGAEKWIDVDGASMRDDVLVLTGNEDRNNATKTISFWVKDQNLRFSEIVSKLNFRPDADWSKKLSVFNKEFTVKQAPFEFEFSPKTENDKAELPSNNLEVYRTEFIKSSGGWYLGVKDGNNYRKLDKGSDWLKSDFYSSDDAEKLESEVRVSAWTANPDLEKARSLDLYLCSTLHDGVDSKDWSSYGYSPKKITLTQRAFTFLVNNAKESSTVDIPAFGTDEQLDRHTVKIVSDGKWTVESSVDWLNPYPASGEAGEDLTVVLKPKVYGSCDESRSGTLTISCQREGGLPDIKHKVTVIQDKLIFDVDGPEDKEFNAVCNYSYNGSLLGTDSWLYSVTVPESFGWKLVREEGGVGLATTSDMSGRGPAKSYNLYPTSNGSKEGLNLKFHFESTDDRYETPLKTKSFTISQKGYVWDSKEIGDKTYNAMNGITDGSNAVSFDCSGPWTASSDDWVTISATSGTINPRFTVNPTMNPGKSKREAIVTVKSEIGDYSKQFKITQDGYIFDEEKVEITEKTLNADEHEVKFKSSGKWEIKNNNGLVTVNGNVSGAGDASGKEISLKFTPTNYFEESANRNSTFAIVSVENGTHFTKEITISQPAYEFKLDPKTVVFSGPKDEDEKVLGTVTVTDGETLSALAVSPENLGAARLGEDGKTVIFKPKANYSQNSRNVTVSVSTTLGGKKKSFDLLTQPAYKFYSTEAVTLSSFSGSAGNVTISSDGDWELLDVPDWINVSEQSGSAATDKIITFTTKTANSGLNITRRSRGITFRGKDDSSLTRTIAVTQGAFSISKDVVNFTSGGGSNSDIRIICDGSWNLSVPESETWLSVTPERGTATNGTTITLSASANAGYNVSSRATDIILTGPGGQTFTVNVTQGAFSINEDRISLTSAGVPNKVLTVVSDVEWSIRKASNANWLTVPSGGNATTGTDISLTASANMGVGADSRSETLNFTGPGSQTIRVTVTQNFLSVNRNNVIFNSSAGSDDTLRITGEGNWTVSKPSVDTWLTVSPESGSGEGTVRLSVAANNNIGATQRSTTLTITSGSNTVATITVTQAAPPVQD